MREIRPGDGGHVVVVDGHLQSHVDLDDPRRLVFDYVRRLGDLVDVLAPEGTPLRVVHVGGAGMTLARYVAATRPRSSQVVLEPDEQLTELVRRELPLPPRSGIRVRPVDGRAGLPALPDARADLLVLDAYDGGRVPPELLTAPALAEVARVLAPTGSALLNVADQAPFPLVRTAVAGLRPVLPHVAAGMEPATRRARRPGNVLLLASRRPLPVAAWRSRSSTGAAPYRVLDADGVSASFGGGTPLEDPDTAC
jgi:spermidine synthase